MMIDRSVLLKIFSNSDSPQTAPFLPNNQQFQHTDAINVRRRLYSPSKLPQGLTEGQLVMLLQKGQQCLPNASNLNNPPTILTPAAVPGDIQVIVFLFTSNGHSSSESETFFFS